MFTNLQRCLLLHVGLAALLTYGSALCVHAQSVSAEPEEESVSARYQSTYNWQTHPAFAARYSGTNSLSVLSERMYTFSATAHWGWRVWQGGEIYFNPEVVQGVPFSNNLIGLGGFTNGEITRAAGTTPKLYRQRLFLRQTWNAGGGREQIEGDFNQLAGSVDRDRWVLTAGNFSTLDVFDNNAYAKDPRTQFMNWGNWTHAAYDYAADSRGFGWGAALEWYKENWALRAGRMTGPREPNGLAVDYAIGKHYGDQFEIERAHSIGNQPGKVRVLAWRNRAVLARFDDATQYLAANPSSTQAILNVRNGEQIKYGVGINIEQALSTHAGWFLRAMKADGRTETHAFTEADGSFSSGLQLKGGAWGRNDDAIGISLGRNTLSNERRRYLAAGGMSFFIGDGALSYRAEQVLEAYYSLSVNKLLTLTADAQRINNPAYNSARGPVNVYALRMHAEF